MLQLYYKYYSLSLVCQKCPMHNPVLSMMVTATDGLQPSMALRAWTKILFVQKPRYAGLLHKKVCPNECA